MYQLVMVFWFEAFKSFWNKHISGLLLKSLRKWISKASYLIDSISRITRARSQNWFSHSKMRSFWSLILIFHLLLMFYTNFTHFRPYFEAWNWRYHCVPGRGPKGPPLVHKHQILAKDREVWKIVNFKKAVKLNCLLSN